MAASSTAGLDPIVQSQGLMLALSQRAQAIDLRRFEEPEHHPAIVELEQATTALLHEGQALLHDVLRACEATAAAVERTAGDLPTEPDLTFDAALDLAVEGPSTTTAIEQLAFMAAFELRQCAERVTAGAALGHGARLLACDTGLRRLRRALSALDAQIASAAGIAPVLDHETQLASALRIRAAYAKFNDRVAGEGAPSTTDLRTRLRRLGTQIAVMIGWDVFAELRVQDRMILRDLQRRVLDWLRAGDAATPVSGVRLWQDLVNIVEMFRQVSRRQELMAHDRELLATLAPQLTRLAVDQPVPEAAWTTLRRLRGLDPELDRLLVHAPPPVLAVAPLIGRLWMRLSTAPLTSDRKHATATPSHP